jgi:beta-lactamase regulating signal transducer with metallopeptidase domain
MDGIITFLNTTGKSFVGFSSSMLIQSSVLIILLLALDAFLRKKVRVVFLYGIWMLVLVKLVLPTTLSSPTGLGNWFGDKVSDIITETASIPEKIASILQRIKPVTEKTPYGTEIFILPLTGISPAPISHASAEFTLEASPPTAALSWQGFTFLGWLTAVTAMLLLLIRRMFLVKGLLAKYRNPSESMVDTLKRCCKQMGVNRPVFMRISRVAAGPSVCGLFRPTILIPQSLLHRLKREDLRSILLHELAHIKGAICGLA